MKRFTETQKWDDPWFRSLSGPNKLIFLYLIDRCDNAGFWEIDIEAMAFHTKLDSKHFEGAWKALERGIERGIDGASEWVRVKNFLRHQKNEFLNPDNPAHKQIIAILRDQVGRFPSVGDLIPDFESPKKGASKGLQSPIGTGKGIGKGNGEGVGEPSKPSKSKGTVDDLKAFAIEIGMPESDGEAMFHHWEANGWKNGKNPVKDWKAGMRNWKAQGWLASQNHKAPTHIKPPHRAGNPNELKSTLKMPIINLDD